MNKVSKLYSQNCQMPKVNSSSNIKNSKNDFIDFSTNNTSDYINDNEKYDPLKDDNIPCPKDMEDYYDMTPEEKEELERLKAIRTKRNEEAEKSLEEDRILSKLYEQRTQLIYDEISSFEKIANSDNYDGEIPEYNDKFSSELKCRLIYSMASFVQNSNNSEYGRETYYERELESSISKLEEAKKNTNINSQLRDFKIKYYEDKIDVSRCLLEAVKSNGNNGNIKKILDTTFTLLCFKDSNLSNYKNEYEKIKKMIFKNHDEVIDVQSQSKTKNSQDKSKNPQTDKPDLLIKDPTNPDKLIMNPKWIKQNNSDIEKIIQRENEKIDFQAKFYLAKLQEGFYTTDAIEKEYFKLFAQDIDSLHENIRTYDNNAERKDKLKNNIFYEMRENFLITQESQSAYLCGKKRTNNNQREEILKELENRQTGKQTNENYTNWTNEDLNLAVSILEDEYKIINELYHQIVPDFWEENSNEVLSMIYAVGKTIASKNKRITITPDQDLENFNNKMQQRFNQEGLNFGITNKEFLIQFGKHF